MGWLTFRAFTSCLTDSIAKSCISTAFWLLAFITTFVPDFKFGTLFVWKRLRFQLIILTLSYNELRELTDWSRTSFLWSTIAIWVSNMALDTFTSWYTLFLFWLNIQTQGFNVSCPILNCQISKKKVQSFARQAPKMSDLTRNGKTLP